MQCDSFDRMCFAYGTNTCTYLCVSMCAQESLGGNAKTTLLVCVADAKQHVDESLMSLQFGSRAMCVKNKPVVCVNTAHTHTHTHASSSNLPVCMWHCCVPSKNMRQSHACTDLVHASTS